MGRLSKILKVNMSLKAMFSSALGTIVRRWIVGSSLLVLLTCVVFFYINMRNVSLDRGMSELVRVSQDAQNNVQAPVAECLGLQATISNVLSLASADTLGVRLSRKDVMNIVRSNYLRNPDLELMGFYYGWEEFDGRDESLKHDPLYAKYYGRMCQFYRRQDTSVVSDKSFMFDDKLYQEVLKVKSPLVMSATEIVVAGNKKVVIPVLSPIMRGQDVVGCLVSYLNVAAIKKAIVASASKIMDKSAMIVADETFTIVEASCADGLSGKKIHEVFGSGKIDANFFYEENKPRSFNGVCFNIASVHFYDLAGHKWSIISYVYDQYLLDGLGKKLTSAIILAAIMLVLISIMAISIGQKIGVPIQTMLKGVKQLASGNLNVSFNYSFTQRRETEIAQLMVSLNSMVKNLKRIVSDVKQSAININGASRELARSASMMASGANEQASASEEVSSAMMEMTSSIQRNADNARQTEEITNLAVKSVLKANDSVTETVESMKTITAKIGIINEIVGKTDLLAVNAAIEAARVGELGKGFTVVASEIRKLAEKSQAAAKEIDELTVSGVKQAENSGQLLAMLVPEINRTSALVHEITSSSMEQNSNAVQVNNAIQQLNDITQQNASTAEELSTSADESQSQAESLDDTMAFFRFEDADDDEISSLTKQAEEILQRIDVIKAQKAKRKK